MNISAASDAASGTPFLLVESPSIPTDAVEDGFVVVEKTDAVEALAYYIAMCVMSAPEAQAVAPAVLQKALVQTLKVRAKPPLAPCHRPCRLDVQWRTRCRDWLAHWTFPCSGCAGWAACSVGRVHTSQPASHEAGCRLPALQLQTVRCACLHAGPAAEPLQADVLVGPPGVQVVHAVLLGAADVPEPVDDPRGAHGHLVCVAHVPAAHGVSGRCTALRRRQAPLCRRTKALSELAPAPPHPAPQVTHNHPIQPPHPASHEMCWLLTAPLAL